MPVNASAGSPAYSALQTRQAIAGMSGNGSARVLGAPSGYWPGRQPTVLTVTSTTWTIGPFAALVDPAFTTTQGGYWVSADANNTNTNVAAADATNPRIDILYVQVNDTDIDSSGSRTPTVAYLAGTAAASPVAPAAPARSFVLATISVPHSGAGSPTIAINNTFAVAAGGILPVANATAGNAQLTNPSDGQFRYDQNLNALQVWDGAALRTVVQDRTTYTPAFTTVSGSPALGNGILTGWYQLVGRRCDFTIDFTIGSTTNMGTGLISLSLPIAATSVSPTVNSEITALISTTNGNIYAGIAQVAPGATTFNIFAPVSATASNIAQIQSANAGGGTGTGIPLVAAAFTFGSGNVIRVNGSYWVS